VAAPGVLFTIPRLTRLALTVSRSSLRQRGPPDSPMRQDPYRVPTAVLPTLLRRIPAVQHTQSLGDALRILAQHPTASAVAVLRGEVPVGVICRELIGDVVRLPCYRGWIHREHCVQFVSHAPHRLCIDATVIELARALTPTLHRHPADPLVVTRDGAYLGMVERPALMQAVIDLRHVPSGPPGPPGSPTSAGHGLAPDCPQDLTSTDFSATSHGPDTYAVRREH